MYNNYNIITKLHYLFMIFLSIGVVLPASDWGLVSRDVLP